MKHLDLANLIATTDPATGKTERGVALTHLSSCADCRDRFISVNSFRSALSKLPEDMSQFELTADCVPVEEMGDFLGGRLPGDERERYSAHVADCDICFERAAFFSHATVKMTEGVLQMAKERQQIMAEAAAAQAPVKQRAPEAGFMESMADMVKRWLVSPVPAYAFAAVLLMFMVFGTPSREAGVVDLGSNVAFTIYETPKHSGPSFGFSDAGKKVGETGAGLNVEKTSSGYLQFSWNDVEGASEYHFALLEITPENPREVFNTRTAEPTALVDLSHVKAGKAYRWNVSGAMGGGKVFTTIGQFALTE